MDSLQKPAEDTSSPPAPQDEMKRGKEKLFNPQHSFDDQNPEIKKEILEMIVQYLADEGFTSSMLVLEDEAKMDISERLKQRSHFERLVNAILKGDWNEAEVVCQKKHFRNNKSFLYSIYKQQYFELIERQELQKAFTHLTKRLKPLEAQASVGEFKDLCYLLTCRQVQEAASFKHWNPSFDSSRQTLIDTLGKILEVNSMSARFTPGRMEPRRLLKLLHQAAAYQIEYAPFHPVIQPQVPSLMTDYSSSVIPNSVVNTLTGHLRNVKCVTFLDARGARLASGSSDNTVRVWNATTGVCEGVLEGHTSRVWDLSPGPDGLLASASADGTVRLWDTGCGHHLATLGAAEGPAPNQTDDMYTVAMHPDQTHLACGGFDKQVSLYDLKTEKVIRTFTGHQSSVAHLAFTPYGNTIVTGSKDATIKFWDVMSGVCVNTISTHLGQVTSVAISRTGLYLLSSSKDNSHRLWDIRMSRPLSRYKGHNNTSKNFIRAAFGANDGTVMSGSEDGKVYLWDTQTSQLLERLEGHTGMVYTAVWNENVALMASCSQDNMVKLWGFDPARAGLSLA